ncbi:Glycosyl transferase family 2 [Pseudobutyrivibrio sp. ACV-2]|uniref:glycosyltransferase family 2 protein n=1 Tax=Pseudobutyrivibrio sp. ACV-2 TaxID=1520801 RepID=UPI0008969243|nr:glycosyltransferase [Pseudobutyrivibrio sp. ACV-2]SEA76475.1 Glycosyl transferase family 2 [Pseudobutyrivibrio sp. ACV-2]
MGQAYFTLIVWAIDTDMDQFKDMLESIDEQEYRDFELYILDNNPTNDIQVVIKEFFPDIVDKVHYRRLKKKQGAAYAYNIGAHFAEGNQLVYVGQHDRLSFSTLSALNDKLTEIQEENGDSEEASCIIYSDHDELIGLDRRNPHFKPDFNKELFLQTNYIGDFICISKSLYKRLGTFQEKAQNAYIYEYILRAAFKKEKIYHIPSLLYHKRVIDKPMNKEQRAAANFSCKEHLALAIHYLRQSGVICEGRVDQSLKKWHIDYDESSFRRFGGDYMFLRDEKVRLFTRNNAKKMYAVLSQPDVAVVGVRFLGRGFTYDNAGYIFDENGNTYPAFHGQRIFRDTYEGLGSMPRDVAFVDAGCCMIDAKVYRILHGFDTRLSGNDAMFDFCIRARKRGYRTVVLPQCIAIDRNGPTANAENEEEQVSANNTLLEKHGAIIKKGDGFYNRNLPMGNENYILPGTESDS